jgi:rubredoxin
VSWWICSACEYVLESDVPPEQCPQCNEKCLFSDVSCYIPECGGPERFDPGLVALKVREAKGQET